MISFDLSCGQGHVFEGWFRSADDFTTQQQRRLVHCPTCGNDAVQKRLSPPNVGRKGNQVVQPEPRTAQPRPAVDMRMGALPELPEPVRQAMAKVAEFQAEAIRQSEWVGSDFAEEARAIHYGEKDEKLIHGQASADEARELLEEGIGVAPLLIPVVPPEAKN